MPLPTHYALSLLLVVGCHKDPPPEEQQDRYEGERFGYLTIITPSPSELSVDGTDFATTPFVRHPIKPGDHEGQLESGAKFSFHVEMAEETSFAIVEGSGGLIEQRIEETGSVTLHGPESVPVLVSGQRLGETPFKETLPVGNYRFDFGPSANRQRYESAFVTIGVGEHHEIELVPLHHRGSTGSIIIATAPWANVYFEGVRIGQTPGKFSLPAGRQRLTLANPDSGLSRTVTADIQPGQTIRKRISLE